MSPVLQVTPAHTDPHHNLLAQVRGRKYVRLYQPAAMDSLYPCKTGLTTNTSQVLMSPTLRGLVQLSSAATCQ